MYEYELDDQLSSSVKRKKKVGNKTVPWGTPLLTGKKEKIALSAAADIEWFERKLGIRKKNEGGNLKEKSLESRNTSHGQWNILDVTRAAHMLLINYYGKKIIICLDRKEYLK